MRTHDYVLAVLFVLMLAAALVLQWVALARRHRPRRRLPNEVDVYAEQVALRRREGETDAQLRGRIVRAISLPFQHPHRLADMDDAEADSARPAHVSSDVWRAHVRLARERATDGSGRRA